MIDGISSEDWLCNLSEDIGSHFQSKAYLVILPFQPDRKSAQHICECPAWSILVLLRGLSSNCAGISTTGWTLGSRDAEFIHQ